MHKLILLFVTCCTPVIAHAAGPSCRALFETQSIYVQSIDGPYQSQLVEQITESNLLTIFSHNYWKGNNDIFGAKAIGIAMPGERPQIFFFATGEGSKTWNVHHANALNAVLLSRDYREVHTHNISREVLPHVQGYEFTLENISGQWIITKMGIDSGITKLQIVTQTPLSLPSQQALLAEINKSIPKHLRTFKTPAFPPALLFREWMWMRVPNHPSNDF